MTPLFYMTCEKKSSDKNFGAECGPDATPMLSQAKVWRPQNKRITTRSFAALRMTNKGGGGTRSLPPTTLGPFDSLRSRPSTAPLGCAPLGFAPLGFARGRRGKQGRPAASGEASPPPYGSALRSDRVARQALDKGGGRRYT